MLKKHFLLIIPVILFSCGEVTSVKENQSSDKLKNGVLIAPADDTHLSPDLRKQYQISSKKIAVRFTHVYNPKTIEIPQTFVSSLYNGLIHIYNSSHPKAVLVTREVNIQASQLASPYEILVTADTVSASGWLDTWRAGETKTGNTELDELLERFGYELKSYSEWANVLPVAGAILHTDQLLNGYATGDFLKEINGIESAAPEGVLNVSFPRDIEVKQFENYLLYRFIGGNAKFRVYSNGSVEYAGGLNSLYTEN